MHKIANLPPAGRASDTVQGRMSLQLKVFQKDDLIEEMQRRATKIVRRVEILLSREKKTQKLLLDKLFWLQLN